ATLTQADRCAIGPGPQLRRRLNLPEVVRQCTRMPTRRTFIAGSIAGALMPFQTASAGARSPTEVSFDVPAGACDCHTHIFGDPEKFPFFSGRTYTPEPALPEELLALHKRLKIQRVVIVTPSVYGTDNSATLYGMQARGGDARGVAVIDDRITE